MSEADWQAAAWEEAHQDAERMFARNLDGPDAESYERAAERAAEWAAEAGAETQARADAQAAADWAASAVDGHQAEVGDELDAQADARTAEIADLETWFSGPAAQADDEPEA